VRKTWSTLRSLPVGFARNQSVVVVCVLGRFLQFPAGLLKQSLGLLGVSAQLFIFGALRFANLFNGLLDMVLGFGQVRVARRVDVGFRALRERYSDKC